LDAALEKTIAAEAVEEKLRAAVRSGRLESEEDASLLQEGVRRGVIREEEALLVREAALLRSEIISVDDFPQDYWKRTHNHSRLIENRSE
jgi:hypothetical protein